MHRSCLPTGGRGDSLAASVNPPRLEGVSMPRRAFRLPFTLLLLALVSLPTLLRAQAQATTGVIRGVVAEPSGAPLPGATVLLRETQTGFQRSLQTNERGAFAASLLPLGTYEVTARGVGFSEVKQSGIALRVGQEVYLQLKLGAGQLAGGEVDAAPPVGRRSSGR